MEMFVFMHMLVGLQYFLVHVTDCHGPPAFNRLPNETDPYGNSIRPQHYGDLTQHYGDLTQHYGDLTQHYGDLTQHNDQRCDYTPIRPQGANGEPRRGDMHYRYNDHLRSTNRRLAGGSKTRTGNSSSKRKYEKKIERLLRTHSWLRRKARKYKDLKKDHKAYTHLKRMLAKRIKRAMIAQKDTFGLAITLPYWPEGYELQAIVEAADEYSKGYYRKAYDLLNSNGVLDDRANIRKEYREDLEDLVNEVEDLEVVERPRQQHVGWVNRQGQHILRDNNHLHNYSHVLGLNNYLGDYYGGDDNISYGWANVVRMLPSRRDVDIAPFPLKLESLHYSEIEECLRLDESVCSERIVTLDVYHCERESPSEGDLRRAVELRDLTSHQGDYKPAVRPYPLNGHGPVLSPVVISSTTVENVRLIHVVFAEEDTQRTGIFNLYRLLRPLPTVDNALTCDEAVQLAVDWHFDYCLRGSLDRGVRKLGQFQRRLLSADVRKGGLGAYPISAARDIASKMKPINGDPVQLGYVPDIDGVKDRSRESLCLRELGELSVDETVQLYSQSSEMLGSVFDTFSDNLLKVVYPGFGCIRTKYVPYVSVEEEDSRLFQLCDE